MEKQSTPLQQTSTAVPLNSVVMDARWPDRFLPHAEVSVDGYNESFLLDTGALRSHLGDSPFSIKYPSVDVSNATSASGKTIDCDLISPEVIKIGERTIRKPTLKRCKSRAMSLLALDLLGQSPFQIDLKNKQFVFLSDLPQGPAKFPIRRVTKGHITIPVSLNGKDVSVLFDTGADITIIDTKYVKERAPAQRRGLFDT